MLSEIIIRPGACLLPESTLLGGPEFPMESSIALRATAHKTVPSDTIERLHISAPTLQRRNIHVGPDPVGISGVCRNAASKGLRTKWWYIDSSTEISLLIF